MFFLAPQSQKQMNGYQLFLLPGSISRWFVIKSWCPVTETRNTRRESIIEKEENRIPRAYGVQEKLHSNRSTRLAFHRVRSLWSMNYQIARYQLSEAYQHSLFFVNYKRSSSPPLFHDAQYITGTVSKKSVTELWVVKYWLTSVIFFFIKVWLQYA